MMMPTVMMTIMNMIIIIVILTKMTKMTRMVVGGNEVVSWLVGKKPTTHPHHTTPKDTPTYPHNNQNCHHHQIRSRHIHHHHNHPPHADNWNAPKESLRLCNCIIVQLCNCAIVQLCNCAIVVNCAKQRLNFRGFPIFFPAATWAPFTFAIWTKQIWTNKFE